MSSQETTRVVNVPIDLDLRIRTSRRQIETEVIRRLGQEWECLWPLPGVEFTGTIRAINSRPGQREVTLQDVRNESQGKTVATKLAAHGLTLVDFFPLQSRAIAATLDPRTVQLRDDLAMLWGWKDPWVLELAIGWGDYEGTPFIEDVLVLRSGPIDVEKRRDAWLNKIGDVVPPIPGYMWRYEQGETPTKIRLIQVRDRLNEITIFSEDVSTLVAPTTPWHVGVDDEGKPVALDIAGSAHMLIAGATRSGKSVATYGLITHVLRMGDCALLLVADPNDTTIAPFESKVAWSSTTTHPAEVTKMLQWVRGEMDRRKPILRAMRRDKLDTFTPELPLIVVVIDEAANYLRHSDKKAAADLTSELLAVVSQGAKYGVRTILITQRPDSTILPTSTRAQLSARLCFRVEDKETSMMAFPDLDDPEVLLTCEPGVGYIKEVAGRPRRFRSIFLDDHWAIADSLTYSQPKIDVGKHFSNGPGGFQIIAPEQQPGVINVELNTR